MRRWWLAAAALAVLATGAGAVLVLRDAGVDVPLVAASPTPGPDPVRTPLLPDSPATAPAPTAAGLTRALATALRAPGLGGRVGLAVVDAGTGQRLLELGAGRAVTPASTAKIVTAVAALTVLDPASRLRTRLLDGGGGDLVLVGGGDPLLGGRSATAGFPRGATLAALAAQVRSRPVRRVLVDDALFTGPRLGPGWKARYVTDGDVAPVTALMVDGGRTSARKNQPRSADPALAAGRQLAALLHVPVVARGVAPAGAAELGHVDSPTVAELVEVMLTRSDNDLAEALGRRVALDRGLPASFAGETAATLAAVGPLLDRRGISRQGLALRDASGLSPLDRVQPAALAGLLAAVGQDGADGSYAPLLSGLPVAGFDGTLQNRYRKAPSATAAGAVRAKTGTLNGVSALAGLVRTRSGHLLAFDVTADGVSLSGTLAAQAALDGVATALASCGCS